MRVPPVSAGGGSLDGVVLANLSSALRCVDNADEVVICVPIAQRPSFGLLDVEAKRAEHGERCDDEKGGTHGEI